MLLAHMIFHAPITIKSRRIQSREVEFLIFYYIKNNKNFNKWI